MKCPVLTPRQGVIDMSQDARNPATDELRTSEAGKKVGSEVKRVQDPELLTGEAEFTDDLTAHRMTHAAILRSPHGHAEIEGIDTAPAEAIDGVIDVFTIEDIDESGVPGTLIAGNVVPQVESHQPERPLLARDKVTYQGEPVAIVLAEDRYLAHSAVDKIEVRYNEIDAVVDPEEAVEKEEVPELHDDVDDNIAFQWGFGDEDQMDDIFEAADNIVDIDLVNQRVMPTPMEPRAALSRYKASDSKLRVDFSTQMPHNHRPLFAEALGLDEHKIHINAPDVGGGFGTKAVLYPSEILTSWCSMELNRPVKWTSTRTEGYETDAQGRGHHTHAELAVDDDGAVQGLRVNTTADMGAYMSTHQSTVPTAYYGTMLSGNYTIPAISCWVTGVYTNTSPVDAYRGAGRPEATYVVERLMDVAADTLDMDPTEIRRRNFIPENEFPYQSATGMVYDSGDYETNLQKALNIAEYDKLRNRQKQDDDTLVGVGVACMVENAGAGPSEATITPGPIGSFTESGQIRVNPGGTITAYVGTSDHGQGSHTAYSQIISDELGVPVDDIEIVDGDTESVPEGSGTMGSHSAAVGGGAVKSGSEKVFEKAQRIAAHQLEADENDIEFEDGEFQIAGAPEASMTFQEVAHQAHQGHQLPEGMEPGLEASSFFDPDNFTFTFGTHIAIVEVDPETGSVEFDRYISVEDCGVQINPQIVEGQVHGGVAQGIGQALYEGVNYDENGNLINESMQDYAIPRASDIPKMESESTCTPAPHHPMGVKGMGETPTIGSTPAVVSAVCDAIGVDHLDMPLTEEKIWRTLHEDTGGDA
jgi:carbon-monoxide dehydrogenase large subunit